MSVHGTGGRERPGMDTPGEAAARHGAGAGSGEGGAASLGDLFGSLTEDLSRLVHSEMELARTELRDEAVKAGRAAGLLGSGAAIGYLALLLLFFAAAWGLAEVVDAGWAFLIVGLVAGAAAVVLALTGRDRLRRVHPMPDQTVETLKEDAQWARAQMK
jgi:hypothetical protein